LAPLRRSDFETCEQKKKGAEYERFRGHLLRLRAAAGESDVAQMLPKRMDGPSPSRLMTWIGMSIETKLNTWGPITIPSTISSTIAGNRTPG
jgi:hypothetical protein